MSKPLPAGSTEDVQKQKLTNQAALLGMKVGEVLNMNNLQKIFADKGATNKNVQIAIIDTLKSRSQTVRAF